MVSLGQSFPSTSLSLSLSPRVCHAHRVFACDGVGVSFGHGDVRNPRVRVRLVARDPTRWRRTPPLPLAKPYRLTPSLPAPPRPLLSLCVAVPGGGREDEDRSFLAGGTETDCAAGGVGVRLHVRRRTTPNQRRHGAPSGHRSAAPTQGAWKRRTNEGRKEGRKETNHTRVGRENRGLDRRTVPSWEWEKRKTRRSIGNDG